MEGPRGIGRVEVAIGVAVVAIVAVIAIPLGMGASRSSKRAEVPLNVDAIRTAEITQREAFDEYVSAKTAPRDPTTLDARAVPWEPSSGFVKLAWKPVQAEVYGTYSVTATADGFTVVGTCDVDGDGERAEFRATQDENARMVTPEDVY
jgi:Tfp pilus assembly protein PilE